MFVRSSRGARGLGRILVAVALVALAAMACAGSADARQHQRLSSSQLQRLAVARCARLAHSHSRARGSSRSRRRGRNTVCAQSAGMRRARLSRLSPKKLGLAKTSSAVGYVTDFGSGSNDKSFPGSSIFVNALTGAAPLGTYTTGDLSKTVSVTDVPVSAIDAGGVAALAPYDTLILYQVCDIGSHPATVAAINSFLSGGGKVMLFDADRCAPKVAGLANYSSFLFPFTTSSPGPEGALGGPYTALVASTLTEGLSVGVQEGDAVGDANVFESFSGHWCASITAENVFKATGFVEATAQTPAGGLVIYEGEDFWFTDGPTPHLRLVFDDMLKQPWSPAGLPCTIPASGISLSPLSQSHTTGTSATVTAKVVDDEGTAVPGVSVKFDVTAGPNAGLSGTATTDGSGEASFTYTGSSVGTDTVLASFVDEFGATHESNTVEVIWEDAKITASGQNLSGTEGAVASGTVATFTDPDTSATASEYAATIEWGDGSTSTGTVTGGGGSFSVSGSHTYVDEGSYPLKVIITDVDNVGNSATTSSTAEIGDAALSASGVSVTSPMSFSGTVASLTDANTGGSAADFTATIEWGDGTSSTGTVSGGAGSYSVSGSHTYASTGPFEVTVKIVDDGGSTAEAKSSILVFATTAGGTFVIGDGDAAVGTPVTFWGAQWWKLNSLSGGTAPAAFKGFANTPSTPPACGTGWSTGPGNSSGPPPSPLPAYIAVIVSSHITQSGSQIAGDTAEVVVVKTNSGYAPNPGHAGTGAVVAVVCHS
jgi:Bacterial Ig-like domain (group 1)